MKCVICVVLCWTAGVTLRWRAGNGFQRYDNCRVSTDDKE